jgi:hypothetical protein
MFFIGAEEYIPTFNSFTDVLLVVNIFSHWLRHEENLGEAIVWAKWVWTT